MINTALIICIFVSTLSTMDDVGMYKRAHIGTEFGAVFVDKTLTDYLCTAASSLRSVKM